MADYQFGPFRYDPEQRLLFRQGQAVPLAPKAIDTLQILLEHRGRIVEKADLMKLLWPDTTVEEVGLARNISILRKAIEEDPAIDSYIETVPRRGYRFAAAQQSPTVPSAVKRLPRWMILGAFIAACAGFIYWQFYVPSRYVPRGADLVGLAVVPFESLTTDAERSGLADELTDRLVADLSKMNKIQVVSPSTVRRHQRFGISMGLMGRLLGLDTLIEGGVRTSGTQLTITSRLVDVHTGKVIWAESYDRPLSNRTTTPNEVANQIAAQVSAHLEGSKK